MELLLGVNYNGLVCRIDAMFRLYHVSQVEILNRYHVIYLCIAKEKLFGEMLVHGCMLMLFNFNDFAVHFNYPIVSCDFV